MALFSPTGTPDPLTLVLPPTYRPCLLPQTRPSALEKLMALHHRRAITHSHPHVRPEDRTGHPMGPFKHPSSQD